MSGSPAAKHRLILLAVIVLAFVSGAVVGGVVTSAAAHLSVEVALRGAQGLFEFHQDQKVAAAWNAGDMNTALSHATCAFEVRFGDGARYFDPAVAGWSVWGGAVTQKLIVEPNAELARRARPTDEAIARAKMAVVLERLGRTRDAEAELEQAATASGVRDTATWRAVGLKTVAVTAPPTATR
jgi:hypothetical protein